MKSFAPTAIAETHRKSEAVWDRPIPKRCCTPVGIEPIQLHHVCNWPITTDIALEPNVGFRGPEEAAGTYQAVKSVGA